MMHGKPGHMMPMGGGKKSMGTARKTTDRPKRRDDTRKAARKYSR